MRLALISSACALGIATVAFGCSKTQDRNVQSRPYVPSAAEQRRIDERRAEERRAEEQRAEDRRAEERRLEDERRNIAAEERRLEEERRADEARRAEEARRARPVVGGGPRDVALRATPASAVASIAATRCDREVRCGNVGPKEKYRSRAACIAELQRDKRDDINSDVCRGGVREKELMDCLASIRDEDCGNPLDAITRLNACRTGNLCVK